MALLLIARICKYFNNDVESWEAFNISDGTFLISDLIFLISD